LLAGDSCTIHNIGDENGQALFLVEHLR
jgi:hypothetical protein